jgi:hypothetical protein
LRHANYPAKLFAHAELNRSHTGGNVGIGVTDPDAKLEINGQIKITGGSPSANKVLTSDADGLASWATNSPSAAAGWTDDGTAVRLTTASDKVGIGTTDKLSKLTVKGNSSFSATGTVSKTNGSADVTGSGTHFLTEVGIGDRILVPGTDNETVEVISISSDTLLTTYANFTHDASGQTATIYPSLLRIENSSGQTKFIIDDDGGVGIGTSAPIHDLHVKDSSAGCAVAIEAPTNYDSFLVFLENGTAEACVRWDAANDSINIEANYDTPSSNLLVIKHSTGYVGIGTKSPSKPLDVIGEAAFSSNVGITGDVGIGTSSPGYGLHVNEKTMGISISGTPNLSLQNIQAAQIGRCNGQISFIAKNNAASPENILYSTIQGKTDDITDGSEDGHLEVLTIDAGSISERIRISSAGSLGIGTTDPQSAIHIDDDAGGSNKGYITLEELGTQSVPVDADAPAADRAVLYLKDDGNGKTKLMVRFATGAPIQLAIQP